MATAIAVPPGADDLVCGFLRRGLVQVGDHDLAAGARVGEGDGLADATGRAGDDADLVLELHGEYFRESWKVGRLPDGRE
jgi:hypothetical protein